MRRLLLGLLVALTLFSLPLRPLWVDEIFQLEATRDQSLFSVLHSSLIAPGGMPLAYLLQSGWLKIVGFSVAGARVPALLFGMATVAVMVWVAKQLSLSTFLVALLGLTTPLLFRYATEARPYSQGLFFSLLSTALLIALIKKPTKGKWIAYVLSCVLGVYSQPFALFTPIGHAVYAFLSIRQLLTKVMLSIALTAACYTPWFLISQAALRNEAWPHEMFFSSHQVSPLMILREISGGGFACSISLLLLALFAVGRRLHPLLAFCVLCPVLLVIAADAAFNYFFAIRQLIFVLPPLLLLAVAGAEELSKSSKGLSILLVGVFVTGAVIKNIRWEADHKEDWGKAAAIISQRLSRTNTCVIFDPAGDAIHYYFFEPSLRLLTCRSGENRRAALLVVSPYAPHTNRSGNGAEHQGNTTIISLRH